MTFQTCSSATVDLEEALDSREQRPQFRNFTHLVHLLRQSFSSSASNVHPAQSQLNSVSSKAHDFLDRFERALLLGPITRGIAYELMYPVTSSNIP
jgi:hypothetical protein